MLKIFFSDGSIGAFKAINCVHIMPLYLKAKRTVIIRRVANYIYGNSSADIQKEVNAHNDQLVADDVFKFPNSNIIKITFKF